jgi:hypothetical protein
VLVDNKFGNVNTIPGSTCVLPQTIAGNGSYTCTFSKTLVGSRNNDSTSTPGFGYKPHINVVTARGKDNEGNTGSDTDDETVTFYWYGHSHGYWKTHPEAYPATCRDGSAGYNAGMTIGSVFGIPSSSPFYSLTLQQGLELQGGSGVAGASETLLREAIAALLNKCTYGSDYSLGGSITNLKSLVKSTLLGNNETAIRALATKLEYWNANGRTL